MSATTREQIGVAFFNLVSGAMDFVKTDRNFQHWDQVNEPDMPFLTLLKGPELRVRQTEGLPTLVIGYRVLVYLSTGMDPNSTPETQTNALLDAIDQAVRPTGADALDGNRQTLGGLVSHCYPLGKTFVDTGVVDGKGIVAIPFVILVPWY